MKNMLLVGNRQFRWWPSLRPHVYALAGYAILTALFTYPMIFKMTDHIIGTGSRDSWQNYWNLWWVKEALLELRTNPFFTFHLYHPSGASLYFHTLNFFNGVLAIPVQAVFGLPVAYNFIVFLSFTVTGYGTFLLVDYLAGNKTAAFIAGMAFTFSPLHLANAHGHTQLVAQEFMPLYALFLLKTIRQESRWGHIYSSLFLMLAFLLDLYHTLYLMLFTVVALTYYLWGKRGLDYRIGLTFRVGFIGMLFLILSAPILLPMAREASAADYMVPDLEQTKVLSADLLGFFQPNPFHPLWGDQAKRQASNFSFRVPFTISTSYVLLVLAALGVLKRRKGTALWLLVFIFFFVMALGPILHINGQVRFTDFQVPIPLPYILLYYVPFVRIGRTPIRMAVMVSLALAVLAGYGLAWLYETTHGTRTRGGFRLSTVFALLVAGLIGFESLAIPFPMASIPSVPSFYEALSQDRGEYGILDIPLSVRGHPSASRNMFYQTVHRKRIFEGFTSRPLPNPLADMPVFQRLRNLGPDILQPDIVEPVANVLEAAHMFGFKYVVIHKNMILAPRNFANLLRYLGNPSPYHSDEEVLVFETKQASSPIVSLDQNWHDVQRFKGVPFRWMTSPATLKIFSPSTARVQLELTVFTPFVSKTLEIRLNGAYLGSYPTAQKTTIVTPPFDLVRGENIVLLSSPEGNAVPAEVNLQAVDTRELSMAFENIRLLTLDQ